MATSVMIVSDLSGAAGARTYTLTLDDKTYAVDLTESEYAEYSAAVAKYVTVGRQVLSATTSRGGNRTRPIPARRSREEITAIKTWGAANGWNVPDRGRLRSALIEAYEQANS